MPTIIRQTNKIAALALLIAVIGGCATARLGDAYKPVSEIPTDQGLVYIYRSPKFVGSAIAYDVHVGERKVSEMRPGGYFVYYADFGEVEFWAETESRAAVTIDVTPASVHYVKADIGVGFLAGRPKRLSCQPSLGKQNSPSVN